MLLGLGLGLMKLSTFRKTHGSEHEFKPKHKWSEHTLQLIITSAFSGKILWWYCWTKVDYIESISRLLSMLKVKVPVFPIVAYCQKKDLVIMIFID